MTVGDLGRYAVGQRARRGDELREPGAASSASRVAGVEGALAGDRLEQRGAQAPHVAGVATGTPRRPGSHCSGDM